MRKGFKTKTKQTFTFVWHTWMAAPPAVDVTTGANVFGGFDLRHLVLEGGREVQSQLLLLPQVVVVDLGRGSLCFLDLLKKGFEVRAEVRGWLGSGNQGCEEDKVLAVALLWVKVPDANTNWPDRVHCFEGIDTVHAKAEAEELLKIIQIVAPGQVRLGQRPSPEGVMKSTVLIERIPHIGHRGVKSRPSLKRLDLRREGKGIELLGRRPGISSPDETGCVTYWAGVLGVSHILGLLQIVKNMAVFGAHVPLKAVNIQANKLEQLVCGLRQKIAWREKLMQHPQEVTKRLKGELVLGSKGHDHQKDLLQGAVAARVDLLGEPG